MAGTRHALDGLLLKQVREDLKGVNMKKLLTAVAVCLSTAGIALACGGMTQVDPPSMYLDAGAADESSDSAVDDSDGVCVLA